jgi:hypothetical protein
MEQTIKLPYMVVQGKERYALDDSDLIDDSIDSIPMIGLNTPASLPERALDRLSALLQVETRTTEDKVTGALEIFVSRKQLYAHLPPIKTDRQLQKTTKELERSFTLMATYKKGMSICTSLLRASLTWLEPAHTQVCEELWDVILVYVYHSVHEAIEELKQLFKDHQTMYENLVTTMYGMDDLAGPQMDTELGDKIIGLAQDAHSYNGSMKEVNDLIEKSQSMMTGIDHLLVRLKGISRRSTFATELHKVIFIISMPLRTFHTLVRAARDTDIFKNVRFTFQPPSSSPKPVQSAPKAGVNINGTLQTMRITTEPSSPVEKVTKAKTTSISSSEVSPSPTLSSTVPTTPETEDISMETLMATIQEYLPIPDRGRPFYQLQPLAKRETVELLLMTLAREIPTPHAGIYHSFGFVTASTEDQCQRIGGLYQCIITGSENQSKQHIFQDLCHAHASSTIPGLFDREGYGIFRTTMPHLAEFLSTVPSNRPTVWRLKQYAEMVDASAPSPCLQRDYGFALCRQREEVSRLKAVYGEMLGCMSPLEIHGACLSGSLYENALDNGVMVPDQDKRFLINRTPSAILGYDDERGTAQFQARFWKRG